MHHAHRGLSGLGHLTMATIHPTAIVDPQAQLGHSVSIGAYTTVGAHVSIDEGTVNDVKSFATDLALTFDILHDKSGAIERIYQTTGVPESFLIDRNGTIIRKQIGEHPWNSAANQRIVEELLGEAR